MVISRNFSAFLELFSFATKLMKRHLILYIIYCRKEWEMSTKLTKNFTKASKW